MEAFKMEASAARRFREARSFYFILPRKEAFFFLKIRFLQLRLDSAALT